MAILGQQDKGRGLALSSIQPSIGPHSLISQFNPIAEIGEQEKNKMLQDIQLPEYFKSKLISVLDYQKCQFKVSMLESQVAQAKSSADYKATQIILNVDDLHYEYMINMHLQVTNMLHRGVAKANLDAKKLREALDKTEKKVKIERAMVHSREKRVKELEHNIVQLGYDPNQADHSKKVLEEKDKKIMAMKKRIKALDAYPVKMTKLITASQEN